jgi:hypothetical protein
MDNTKVRIEINPKGTFETRLITNDKRVEPYSFLLKIQPAISKFKKNINQILSEGPKEKK